MQLDVFPRAAHQLQKPVDDFVFADASMAHEQELLAQGEVSRHGFEDARVQRVLVEDEVVGDEEGVVVGVRRQADGRRTDRQRAVLHRQTSRDVEKMIFRRRRRRRRRRPFPRLLDARLLQAFFQRVFRQRRQESGETRLFDGAADVRRRRRRIEGRHLARRPQQLARRQ